MKSPALQRALLVAAFLVVAATTTHLELRIKRLEAKNRDLRATSAKLLFHSDYRTPGKRARLTDEEFRLALQALESRGGVELLNESSDTHSSLQRVNTVVLNRAE